MVEKKQLKQEIKDNPYYFICNWAEELLPFTGRKAFEIISLMPCSLVLPDLMYEGKKVRSNMNLLLLSSPGGAKSSLSKIFESFSLNPVSMRSTTPAKLEHKIQKSPVFTLIIEDFSTISRDPIVIKILEGILGDEKRMQRSTMKKEVDISTDGIGLVCAVPSDIQDFLTGGFIFRTMTMIIFHSADEHSKIGEKIANGIGRNNGYSEKEEVIREYFEELYMIQRGEHPTIEKVTDFYIKDEYKTRAYQQWDKYTKKIYEKIDTPLNWFRSLQEFFRILVAHAFLNVHNRKVENGVIYVNDDDFDVALRLMKGDLETKFKLMYMDYFTRSVGSIKELYKIINSGKINSEQRMILQNLIKHKKRPEEKSV